MREGVAIAAVGALVTALVTALLSGSTFTAIRGWFDDESENPASSDGSSPATVQWKTVDTRDASIAMQVPSDWGAADSQWNVPFDDLVDPGHGLSAGRGAGVTTNNSYDSERAWTGASTAAAERLQLRGRSADELRSYLIDLARFLDFTQDGCLLAGEGAIDMSGYLAYYRSWTGCAGFARMRLFDGYAVSESGDVLVMHQSYSSMLTEDEQQELMTGWSIRPEALPQGEPGPNTDGSFDLPLPPWYQASEGDHEVLP